jgi:glycosyltransferase involved in cell wall biosynthesis
VRLQADFHGADLCSQPDAVDFFLSEVYPLVKQNLPDASLTVTGSTAGVDIGGLRMNSSVKLVGHLKDVRPALRQSAICIVPIRLGGGTRLKILEAMALGTPVVSTAKGAEGLEVVNGEHLLVADEPAEFAGAIGRLVSDPDLCDRLVIQARSLVENSTIGRHCKGFRLRSKIPRPSTWRTVAS